MDSKHTNFSKSSKNVKSFGTIETSLRFVLIIAQIFAQFPLNGILLISLKHDGKSLEFKWRSLKMIYTTLFVSSVLAVIIIDLLQILNYGTNIFIINELVYYGYMLLASIMFVQLAKSWRKLMKEWSKVEVSMRPYYEWPKYYDLRIKLLTTILFLLTTGVYVLKIITYVHSTYQCKKGRDFFYYFFAKESFVYIFQIVDYNVWKAIWMQIVDIYTTYVWSYLDLFIIVMSTSLAMRFAQITERLQTFGDGKIVNELVWKTVREDYNKLCRLCKHLDDTISYIVLLSFAGNLFFILIQLFNSLRSMKNNMEKIYFFVSFGFMILRTILVSLYGAWINDESKRPISILNSVPTQVYNVEIRRFVQQISFDTVSLTGKNFFTVTRGLILNIAGAIVTYELVLIQFNENLLNDISGNGNSTLEDDC